MEHVLGTMWFCALCFIAGAVIGQKLWSWVTDYFPWNK